MVLHAHKKYDTHIFSMISSHSDNFMLRKDRAIWKTLRVKFITGFISIHIVIILHSIIFIH